MPLSVLCFDSRYNMPGPDNVTAGNGLSTGPGTGSNNDKKATTDDVTTTRNAPSDVPATASATRTNQVSAAKPRNTPTTTSSATMAVETAELDDFGLPIKKYVPPARQESDTTSIVSRKSTASNPRADTDARRSEAGVSRASSVSRQKAGNRGDDLESGSDEEFKDAVSAPESDAASRADGAVVAEKGNKQATRGDPVEAPTSAAVPPSGSVSEATDSKTQPTSGPEESPGNSKKMPKAEEKPVEEEDASARTTKETRRADHARGKSEASVAQAAGVISEFSHQQLTAKQPEMAEKDDGEWQVMPAYAPYDIYDDDNKLIAREYNEAEAEEEKYGYGGLGGAGKGYTRVFVDDDAESATSMDDNTQYLFKDKGLSTAVTDEDDIQRDAVSQLQATKELLTEGQRIAYVGLTRLELSAMLKELEDVKASRKVKKEWALGAESLKMWGQKMMVRLYAHMDISPAEQIMIEQLTAHGVMPRDLTPVLLANARVKNPMAEKEKSPSGFGPASPKSSRPTSVSSMDEELSATPPPAYQADDDTELTAPVKMPSQMPTTEKIDIDLRWTVLCDLFLVLIADSVYDSRSRVLLEKVGQDLEIPWVDICRFEKKVTDALEMQQQAEKENWNEEEHMETRRKMDLKRRYVVMGLATVGGGLVIGLSAGLLAPVIGAGLAAGFTTIGVTGTSGFLAGAGGAAIITSTAAASGSAIGVRAANRRTGSVRTFEYRPLHNNKRVNLIITVSGWMTGKVDDVRLPYSTVDPVMGDLYSVLWEPDMLTSMGDTINILATEVSRHNAGHMQDSIIADHEPLGTHSGSSAGPRQHRAGSANGGAPAARRSHQAGLPH